MERLIKENFCIIKVIHAHTSTLPKGKIRTFNSPPRSSHCFAYVLEGGGTYHTDEGRTFSVKAGDVLYLAQNQIYTIEVNCDNYRVLVIDFLLDTADKLKSDCLKTSPTVKTLFEKAIATHNSESTVKNAQLCSIANKIYATICEEVDYTSSFDKQKVNLACSILAQNIENPDFSGEKLAKQCSVSEVHLRRLFSKVLGISPMRYLLDLRFSKAQKLLENNELTVSQIAIECGFSDVYYFSKAYKKHFGHSPTR